MGRTSHFLNLSWSLLAAAALLACGGSQPAAESPAAPGSEAAAEAPAAGALVWSDSLSDKQKADFMKAKVVPAMSKSFQEFDAKTYAEFGCRTCHGPQFKPHPVDFLPELHFKDGKITEAASKPELAQFMHDKVVPQMADI